MKLSHLLSLAAFPALAITAHTAAAQLAQPQANTAASLASNYRLTYISPLITLSAPPAPTSTTVPATVVLKKPVAPGRTCLSIRSYNYTADANNPQLSNSTTCTVAKSNGAVYATAPAVRQGR